MKRKDFIQKIGFLGVGLSLIHWKLLSAKTTIRTFTLPQAAIHIPHGNFAATEVEKLMIPEFNLQCTVQQFMHNGISTSNNDLTVYSFQSDKEVLNVSFTRNGQRLSHGHISGLQLMFRHSEIEATFNNHPFVLRMA